MGEVFLARQEGIGGFARAVVLKKLLPDIQQEDDATRRFLDEARIAAALQHPNNGSWLEAGNRRTRSTRRTRRTAQSAPVGLGGGESEMA